MQRSYTVDKTIENINYTKSAPEIGDYENCHFVKCNFEKTDLSKIHFTECEFRDCNLSMANLTNTVMGDVKFKGCKMLGLHFESCDPFLISVFFEDCTMNYCSFYKVKLRKIVFKNCSLQEVDFTDTDLSGSLFANCELTKARFENTILEGADFRSSYNYSINPELNRIKKAKFSTSGVAGLLDKYDIYIE